MLPKILETAAEIFANATYDPNAKPAKVVRHQKPVSYADALVNFPAKNIHKKTASRPHTTQESLDRTYRGAPLV